MPQLQPVDHDPFAPATVPVDHDPFADDALASSMTHWAERPNPAAPYVEMGGLIAKHFRDKAVSALTAPRDAFTGAMAVTDPDTGMPSREAMERGQAVANLAMTGGMPFARAGAAGMAGGRLVQPGAAAVESGMEKAPGTLSDFITAYHGSPHDFDRFDLSKIGTGEGAQAYGHGLYFAENKAVAEEYKKMKSEMPTIHGKPILDFNYAPANSTGHPYLDKTIHESFGDMDLVRKTLEANTKAGPGPSDLPFWANVARERVANSKDAIGHLDKLEQAGAIGKLSPGKMYQVAIKAPPEHFLDWDKPLSEQSPKTQQVLLNARYGGDKEAVAAAMKSPDYMGRSMGAFMTDLAHQKVLGSHDKASAALREAGIPGIKYLDQGSRASTPIKGGSIQFQNGQYHVFDEFGAVAGRAKTLDEAKAIRDGKETPNGTRNYVVFDDKLIDILKKYGIAGLAALPAMNAYHHRMQSVDHDPFAQ